MLIATSVTEYLLTYLDKCIFCEQLEKNWNSLLKKKLLISTNYFTPKFMVFYTWQYVALELFRQMPLLALKYAVLSFEIVYKVIFKAKQLFGIIFRWTNYILIFSSEVTHNKYTRLIIAVRFFLVQLSINHDHTYFSNSSINPIIPVVS